MILRALSTRTVRHLQFTGTAEGRTIFGRDHAAARVRQDFGELSDPRSS